MLLSIYYLIDLKVVQGKLSPINFMLDHLKLTGIEGSDWVLGIYVLLKKFPSYEDEDLQYAITLHVMCLLVLGQMFYNLVLLHWNNLRKVSKPHHLSNYTDTRPVFSFNAECQAGKLIICTFKMSCGSTQD